MKIYTTDILITGGGTGGCAAALAVAQMGYRAIVTEETDWIGGQLTSQMVPPDEHRYIERFGCTARYRRFRDGVRHYYREHYPLLPEARADRHLNPGGGTVSSLCYEPKVGVAVLEQMLAPYLLSGQIRLLFRSRPVGAQTEGDQVRSVRFAQEEGEAFEVEARYFLDATELGDLLPLTGAEYVTGAESQAQTGEPHALCEADPGNVQAFTWCLPLGFDPDCPEGCDRHRIEKPASYTRWRDEIPPMTPPWPGPLLSWMQTHPITLQTIERTLFPPALANEMRPLWRYRQIVQTGIHCKKVTPHEVTMVNWPQNDYFHGNLIDQPEEIVATHLQQAKELSLSLVYWLQTEAPRPDGGCGFAGLSLRPDISGTRDGLAKAPYIREARRFRGLFTVSECHIGKEARRGDRAATFADSVGIGSYRIDLHPSTSGRNYLDIESLPFQIPLGSLVHRRMKNLLAAGKALSVTHIANGCYRLHPVEWNIGEAAGALAAFCLQKKMEPAAVHASTAATSELQSLLANAGVELEWPYL